MTTCFCELKENRAKVAVAHCAAVLAANWAWPERPALECKTSGKRGVVRVLPGSNSHANPTGPTFGVYVRAGTPDEELLFTHISEENAAQHFVDLVGVVAAEKAAEKAARNYVHEPSARLGKEMGCLFSKELVPGVCTPSKHAKWMFVVRSGQRPDGTFVGGYAKFTRYEDALVYFERKVSEARASYEKALSGATFEPWACYACGHPVAAEGVTLPDSLDYDLGGRDRARCSGVCTSDATCTVSGNELVQTGTQ